MQVITCKHMTLSRSCSLSRSGTDTGHGVGNGVTLTQGGAAYLFSAWFEPCVCAICCLFYKRMPDVINIGVKLSIFNRALLSNQPLMLHCFRTLLKLTSYEQPQLE